MHRFPEPARQQPCRLTRFIRHEEAAVVRRRGRVSAGPYGTAVPFRSCAWTLSLRP
ncbi:hypothetical protein GCM10027028_13880 [Streptomyces sundarbansensis]